MVFSVFKLDNKYNICTQLFPLQDLLTEYKCRNSKNLRVCSVAVNKGIVDQIEHLGRSFSAKDTAHYGKVRYGDVVYTKSPTGCFPYGIVKQNQFNEDVAVSPLYGVFEPKNYEVGYLLHVYFEQHENANNYIKPLAQKGAKNTINITNDRFLDGKIVFPTLQKDIVKLSNMFKDLQKMIEKEELFLATLLAQKNALSNLMFI